MMNQELSKCDTVDSEINRGFYFRETWRMQSFLKIKSSRNGKITLSFVNMAKSYPSQLFLMSQICLLTLFAKIKFTQKFFEFTVVLLGCYTPGK